MGALQYAGSSSGNGTDIVTKRTVDTSITGTTPNQITVKSDVLDAIDNFVEKEYVDLQDSRFAPVSEFAAKDKERNVPKSTVNTPGNPTTLPIPASRLSLTGAGYVMGPYGFQNIDAATSNGSSVQIASLTTDLIPKDKKFWPIAFGQVLVTSADTGGLPVIEIRSGGGMLLSTGRGRTMFTGAQGITAMPVVGGDWPVSTGGPLVVTMSLSDFNGKSVIAKDGPVWAIGGAVYILVGS